MEPAESVAESRVCGVFTARQAVEAFSADYLNIASCTLWVLNQLHIEGPHCPECEARIEDKTTLENFWKLERCNCKNCGKWFNALTGTILHKVQIKPHEAFILATLSGLHVDIKEIARIVQVHPDTVRLWQMKFKAMEARHE